MSTLYEDFQTTAQAAGGAAWIEELLIRGSSSGIRGAHVVIGWSAPGVPGATVGGVSQPAPLNVIEEDELWQQVCSAINAAAISQLATLQQQLAEVTAQRDELLLLTQSGIA